MTARATLICAVTLGLASSCTTATRLQLADGDATTSALEQVSCTPTGAHAVHEALPVVSGCQTCHACGGTYELFPLTLPRGTTIAGGEIDRGPPANCTVACHFPFGGAPVAIDWTTPGPLACTSCHNVLDEAGGAPVASDHGVSTSSAEANRAGCRNCHVSDSHLSGHILVDLGNGTVVDTASVSVDAACQNCHSGASARTLGGATAPRLPDYASLTGDFHGARAGTGFGGTLKAPYVRGQGPLACQDCHATHASGNPYLLAASVNGAPVATGITTSGVHAEQLCETCHEGARHAVCTSCHGVDPAPSGSTCFFCHGHEGLVNFPWPDAGNHRPGPSGPGCVHCHSPGWMAPPESVPPVITRVTVSSIQPNGVTIDWTTNEKATTYVEYGISEPIASAGNGVLSYSHRVVLSGLSAATAYVFRVRSTDGLRNVALSPLSTFSTSQVGAPMEPTLVDNTGLGSWSDVSTPITLAWSAVTAPSGSVQYRAVASTSPTFATLAYDSGFIATTSYTITVPYTSYCDSPTPYYWRVIARDAATLVESPWSRTDDFTVCWWTDADW